MASACTVSGVADDFDKRDAAFDEPALRGEIDDLPHGHQTAQLRLDLADDHGRAGSHQRDAREFIFAIDFIDRQTFDVIAAAGKHAGNAGQHAGFVIDQNGEAMGLWFLRLRRLHKRRRWRDRYFPFCSYQHHPVAINRAADIAGIVAEDHLVVVFAGGDHREAIFLWIDADIDDAWACP